MRVETRGQTEVIGLILLIGISTAVIGGSIIVATSSANDLSLAAQSENAKNSMSHIESEINPVAIGDATTRQVQFSQTADGQYRVRPDAGEISLTYTVEGTEELNVTRPVGAVVYSGSDREIAYQGGGVWSKEGDSTQMISQPEFDYTRQSLTFPIIQLRQSGENTGAYEPTTQATTLESDTLDYPLENGTVEISVTSEYYQGWYSYFTTQTETEAEIDHDTNTATATLTVPDIIVLDNSVALASVYDPPSGQNNDPVIPENELEENRPLESADPLIEAELAAAESANDNDEHSCISESGISGDCELTAGTYYVDSDVDLSGDLTFDVSDGNITIATEETFDLNSNSVSVEGDTENVVSYYIAADLHLTGNGEITHADGGSPIQNQIFLGGQFTDGEAGSGTIDVEAIIYAPESDTEAGGNFKITGAFIGNSLDVSGQAGEVRRGNLPSDYELDVTGTGDTIRFMHVTTNRVELEIQNSKLNIDEFESG